MQVDRYPSQRFMLAIPSPSSLTCFLAALQLCSCPLCRRHVPCSLQQEEGGSNGIEWQQEFRWFMVTNWISLQGI